MDLNQLETEHLTLRPLAPADAGDLFAARGDAEVMRHWDAEPDASPFETALVIGLFVAEMRAGNSMYWSIRLRQDQSFIGVCDLSEIRVGESADIGFMLVRRFWGIGFGGEIVRCLLSAAQSLSLKIVTARIHSENVRSRRLLLNAGFRIVEEMPMHEIRPGFFRDCVRLECGLNAG